MQKQRQLDETGVQERLKKHYKKLQGQAGDGTICDGSEWSKFRNSIRKTTNEISASTEILESLNSMILCTADEVKTAESDLARQLLIFAQEHRHICEEKLTEKVDLIVVELQNYADSLRKIYAEFNVPFAPSDEDRIMPRCIHPSIAETGHECEFRFPSEIPEPSTTDKPETPEPGVSPIDQVEQGPPQGLNDPAEVDMQEPGDLPDLDDDDVAPATATEPLDTLPEPDHEIDDGKIAVKADSAEGIKRLAEYKENVNV